MAYRKSIPKTVRNTLWIMWYGNRVFGTCKCCKCEKISIGNFHCGHIKAHANGGSLDLDNLVPICALCNCSMGTVELRDFMATNGFGSLGSAQKSHHQSEAALSSCIGCNCSVL